MPDRRDTILLVEDDPGAATLERRRLERAGYVVLTARTAEESLQQLGRHEVDLLLLDYRLPGDTDGLALCEQVKAAGFDLPVILVTGFGSEAMVIQALRLGVRDFVAKSAEYLDALSEAQPGLKVLFLSGYTDDTVVRHGVLEQEVAFLQKPFTTTALAQKVREVLNG